MKTVVLGIFLSCFLAVPLNAEDRFGEFDDLYQQRNFQELEIRCRQAMKEEPDCIDATYFLIAMYYFQGETNQAESLLSRFEKQHRKLERSINADNKPNFMLIDSRYVGLYYELGKYYLSNNRYQSAIEWLMRAKSRFYYEPLFNGCLGFAYMGLKDYPNAIKYFSRQTEFDSNDPQPCYNLACVYAIQKKKCRSPQLAEESDRFGS
jgi:tetratricopeptide (TPR) repeat protein